jgi:ketosteroid isomerase-like protein
MTMSHDELVAKRNAIKAKGNWDSTKPYLGAKYVVAKPTKKTTYKIQMRESGDVNFYTIDHLSSKKKAEHYLKEYQAYKPNSEFIIVEYKGE